MLAMPKRKKTSGKKAARKVAVKKASTAKKKAPVKKQKTGAKPALKKRPAPRPGRAPGKKTAVTASTRRPATAKPAASKVTRIRNKMATAASHAPRKDRFIPYQLKHGEEYMGPAQVEHFRKILKKWKLDLMEEVDRTVHHMRDEAANFPDPNDRATQEEEFALELRTRDRERKLIRKIDESLLALDKGDYGYCEICGVEIGVRRLEARPAATLCIDCKTLDEIKERHMG